MSKQTELGKGRIWFIDVARFYAMALVFYGHFIERFMLLKNPAAAAQYKFIYSFHMMLFFVLAGYVMSESDTEFGFRKYLKHRFISRLLPFLFFTAIFMVLPLIFSGDFGTLQLPSIKGYLIGSLCTVFALPAFCIPSWFILMLFSVEFVHYGAFRFLKSNNIKILIGALVFYIVGYWLNLELNIIDPMKRRLVGYNYLFIHEAITMYAFYLMGIYLRRKKFLVEKVSLKIMVPSVISAFLIVLFTFNLNNGPFNVNYYNSVVIVLSSHGNFFWFPITAVAGSFFILFLAKVTPSQKTVVWMGQNTLILMCLNGIFYHYINFRVAKWFLANFSGSFWPILGIGCVMTVASLAVCIPLIYLFNKFVPQLVGKPKISGPIFKNFI